MRNRERSRSRDRDRERDKSRDMEKVRPSEERRVRYKSGESSRERSGESSRERSGEKARGRLRDEVEDERTEDRSRRSASVSSSSSRSPSPPPSAAPSFPPPPLPVVPGMVPPPPGVGLGPPPGAIPPPPGVKLKISSLSSVGVSPSLSGPNFSSSGVTPTGFSAKIFEPKKLANIQAKPPKLEPVKSIPKPGKGGFGIKIALGKTAQSAEPASAIKPSVAKVFGCDDSSDEEEIPEEARMKMRNVGRQTVTSSGPNSFGKTSAGFTDANALYERQLKEMMENVSGDKE